MQILVQYSNVLVNLGLGVLDILRFPWIYECFNKEEKSPVKNLTPMVSCKQLLFTICLTSSSIYF